MDSYFFYYFVNYIFPPFILLTGLVGNLCGFIVMRRKELTNLGPRSMYSYLFASDTLYLIQIIFQYLEYSYDIHLINASDTFCKIYQYFSFSLCPISCFILCYISFDRYISITYPSRRFILRKEKSQLIFYLIIFIFNSIYYIPIAFESAVINIDNDTNVTSLQCNFIDSKAQEILSWMDLANFVIVPFSLMTIISLLLIYTIFASRRRTGGSVLSNRNLNKDIKFSITCLALNLIFLILNLPLAIIGLFPVNYSSSFYSFFYYLFMFSYAVNFYCILLTNKKVCKQFISILTGKNMVSSMPTYFQRPQTNLVTGQKVKGTINITREKDDQ